MVSSRAPVSWKQKSASKPPVASGLKRRRVLATTALIIITALAVGLFVWKLLQRHQETMLVLASSTAASERSFALPPLRYVEESWRALEPLNTQWVHIDQTYDRFTAAALKERIQHSMRRLRTGDALILWIHGKGICQNKRPVLVDQGFRLPDDADEWDATSGDMGEGTIDIPGLLTEMDKWSGPKLLILDWGQELFDPRINCLSNNFMRYLVDSVRDFEHAIGTKASPLWLLVSHMPREISLVDAREQQTLFSRAVSEALLGARRLPSESVAEEHRSAVAPKTEYLTLSSLADYVHRRVRADSAGFQTPWLLKSGQGLVRIAGSNWDGAERIRLVKLDKKRGIPLGLSEKAKDVNESNKKDASKASGSADEPTSGAEVAALTAEAVQALLPQEAPELERLWQAIDAWRAPRSELNGWSESALAPLAAKQIAAKALDLDLRSYAGRFNLNSEILNLQADLKKHPRQRSPDFLHSLDSDVDGAHRSEYAAAVERLAWQRQAAAVQLETVELIEKLSQLKSVTIAIDSVQSLVRSMTTNDPHSQWATLHVEIPEAFDRLIATLSSKQAGRGEAAAVAETMLRSSALSSQQRIALRTLQLQLLLKARGDDAWPAQPLGAPPVVEELAQTQLPQLGERQATHVNTARELLKNLDSASSTGLPLQAVAAADGRDLFVARVLDRLWTDIEAGREFPLFPDRPEAASAWTLRWESAGTETIALGEVVRLDGDKQLMLTLSRSGKSPLAFPEITLTPQNVAISVHGQTYKTDEAVAVEKSWFSGSEMLRLPVSVVPPSQRDQTTASLDVKAQGVKKRPAELAFELPVSEPIQLIAEEQMSRDGIVGWKGTVASRNFFITPFAGRDSTFRFALKNIDSLAHAVELRVYALAADIEDPQAVVGQVPRMSPALLTRMPDLVWRGKIEKGSETVATLAPFTPDTPSDGTTSDNIKSPVAGEAAASAGGSSPPNAPTSAGASTPTGAASTKGTATVAPGGAGAATTLNPAGGCILQLLVDGESVKTFALNVRPKDVSDVIEAQAQLDETGKLQIMAQWVDRNRNGLADTAPSDLSKEKPLAIRWDPLPWRIGKDITISAGSIVLADVNAVPQTITARGLVIDRSEQEIWLDVDGIPRSLVYTLVRDQLSPVTIPTAKHFRCLWRRYSVITDGKSGAAYVPYVPPRNDEQEKETQALIDQPAAVFPDLKSPVQLRFAIDLPEADDRCSILLGPDHVLSNSPDRTVDVTMQVVEGNVVVRWNERDLEVLLDSFATMEIARDAAFAIHVSTALADSVQSGAAARDDPRNMPAIVVDCEPPRLVDTTLSREQVIAGDPELVQLKVSVTDRSSSVTATTFAKKIGAVAPVLLIAPIAIQPNSASVFQMDVSKLEAGDYQLFIELEDRYKHKATHSLGKRLRVNAPPPADPGSPGGKRVVGDLRVKAKRPGGGSIRNPVQFKIEPAADSQTLIGKDEIQFGQLPLGPYKITASFKEGSATYEGSKMIELKKKEDFARTIEIELSKPN